MHFLKHRRLARVLIISSLIFIGAFITGYGAIAMGGILWFTRNTDLILPFAITAGVFIFLCLLQIWFSSQCRCQLCQSPLLKSLKCSKSIKASRLFGSYRLKVATSTIFTGKFRCPYCGEQFDIWKKYKVTEAPVSQQSKKARKAGSALPTRKN